MRCINSLYIRLEKTTPCSSSSWCQDMFNSNLPAHDSCCCTCACWAHVSRPLLPRLCSSLCLLCLRHPIQVPTIPVSLRPRVTPHEGIEPVHMRLALHAIAPTCLCVGVAHVCQLPFRTIHPIRCTLHCSQVAQGAKMLPSWDHGADMLSLRG